MKQIVIILLLSGLCFGAIKKKPTVVIGNPPCSLGSLIFQSEYEYDHSEKIVKGKCVTKDTYRLKIDGKMREVPEEQFYHKTCWEKQGTDMQGMIVQIYPRPEWNECRQK